jgi:hypothetical protein
MNMPKKAVPPQCAECGASKPLPVQVPGVTDEQIATSGGLGCYEWLCGSCLHEREHPDYESGQDPLLVLKRVLPLQEERLFEV